MSYRVYEAQAFVDTHLLMTLLLGEIFEFTVSFPVGDGPENCLIGEYYVSGQNSMAAKPVRSSSRQMHKGRQLSPASCSFGTTIVGKAQPRWGGLDGGSAPRWVANRLGPSDQEIILVRLLQVGS